jgi:glycosyltransferase involved in cell wall biosynthesis
MRYCVPRNIPIIFTNHTRYDLIPQAYIPLLPESISDVALKAYLSPFYKACDLVIVPSKSMMKVLEEHFNFTSPVEVIPNGLDLTPFRSARQPVDRSVFGFNNDHVIATYVGRLSPEKNLSLLIRAFYGVVMTYEHVRLLLVGDGPDRENLENQIKHMRITDKVYFTGMVEYEYIPAYLAACDFFVTPSYSETFGMSTAEAMAAGKPVLGLDAPGSRDIIEDGVTGLITTDDVAVFTAKLVHLSIENELRKQMGINAMQASKKYDIQTTTDSLLQHYQRLKETAKSWKKSSRYKINRLMDIFY